MLIKFRVPNIFRKRVVALGAAGAALAAISIGLAVWLVVMVLNVGPSSFTTAPATSGAIAARTNNCTANASVVFQPVLLAQAGDNSGTATICLQNTTSPAIDETYSLSATNTNATLAAQIKVRITLAGAGAASLATAAAQTCTLPSLDVDGTTLLGSQTQIYLGTLAALAVGDPALGPQTGDRSLPALNAYEKLCFTEVLPASTGASFANLSNNFTLVVTASP